MKHLITALLLLTSLLNYAQAEVAYHLNFENASQNEAQIRVEFRNLRQEPLRISMSRSSPGRYALHEFAKNVYNFKAIDPEGAELEVGRPDPYSWVVENHKGSVLVSYTLFANRADGTYSDISESHAHLNIPATLIYAPALSERTHRLHFNLRKDLGWKVASQLVKENDSTYTAPDLYYLMDSPVEISDHDLRSFTMDGPKGQQTIRFALHHRGSTEAFDQYFEQVKKLVLEEIEVFREAPEFDHKEYTFLGCYLPWVYGDGMEHRNSTILTSTGDLTGELYDPKLGTVAHEFFHAWNVERLRPKSLEPFDFQKANMSGELWFAEGFTSYYTNLIMKRAGILDTGAYLKSITPTFNYVWNSPGRNLFNPIEMSFQAPFVDAATSVDPVNRGNTFISYYSYGHMLGLALDLELRASGKDLDGYFRLLWKQYGKPEKAYTLKELQQTLSQYAGSQLALSFFDKYIYNSEMPDYDSLFSLVGIRVYRKSEKPFTGINIEEGIIDDYPLKGSPAAKAGLSKGDKIVMINNKAADTAATAYINSEFTPGQEIELTIERYGELLNKTLIPEADPTYSIEIIPNASAKAIKERRAWLGSKRKL